jgi:hypothetical protein
LGWEKRIEFTESSPYGSAQRQRLLLLFTERFCFLLFVFGEFLFAPLVVVIGKHSRISGAVAAGVTASVALSAGGFEAFLLHFTKWSADRFGFHEQIAYALEEIVKGEGLHNVRQVFLFEQRLSLGCARLRHHE